MKGAIRSMLVLLAVFALVAAACGDDDGGETGTTGTTGTANGGGPIWVLLPDTASSDRWEGDDLPLFTEAFEAEGLVNGEDFNVVNADGASVIVLTSLDTGSGATIIDQAKEAGVQVIEYDRFNTGGSGGVAYVSFDNVAVGAAMATAMEPAIDGLGLDQPQVVMLNGGEEDNNSFLFRDGYAETVEARVDAGDWALVDDQFVPGWDNAEAQTIMEQILVSANNEVDAVFAANDGLANSVINAVEAAGLDPIPVSGQDATAEGIQNVVLGLQTVSVYKPIHDEAGVTAAIALALRNGEGFEDAATSYQSSLPSGGSTVSIIGINAADGTPADSATGDGVVPYVALVTTGVTIDNIMETVIADGFRTLEEICTGDIAQTDFCQENAA